MGIGKTCLLAISFAILACRSAACQAHSFTALNANDPQFDNLVSTYFLGIEDQSNFVTLRPFLILLRNDSAVNVNAYTVVWTSRFSTGATRTTAHSYILHHHMDAHNGVQMRPGEVRLVSPSFNLTPATYRSTSNFSTFFATIPLPSSAGANDTRARLACVIFSDATFAGGDADKLEERYIATRHAEHDAGVSVLAKERANAPIGDVLTMLAAQARNLPATSTPEVQRFYLTARVFEAKSLLQIYRAGGANALIARATAMSQYPQELPFNHVAPAS